MNNLVIYSIVTIAALLSIAILVPLTDFNFDNSNDLNASIQKNELTNGLCRNPL